MANMFSLVRRPPADLIAAPISAFESETQAVIQRASPRNERLILHVIAAMLALAVILMAVVKLDRIVAGEGRILLNFGSIIDDWINQVAIVRDAYAAEHPDVVRRFLAGWFETIDWMAANRDKTAAIAGREMNVSTEIAARSYDDIMPTYSRDGRFSPGGLKLLGEALVETGAVKTVPDMTTLYTEAYLPAANGK